MNNRTFVLTGLLFIATAQWSALASSLTSVSALVGANTCSQSAPSAANCSVTVPQGAYVDTASASATSSWALSGAGTLEATAFGAGSGTSSMASVSFSNPLIVTGASGSGDLQIVFSGFQMDLLNNPGTATVSPAGVTVGSYSTTATLPNSGGPQTFPVIAPISFGSVTSFTVAFAASATGTFFHDGSPSSSDADGLLLFPAFVVTDANGRVLPNATVQFAPEPATWFAVAVGLLVLLLVRSYKRQISSSRS